MSFDDEVRELFEQHGQGQVFRFWDELNEDGRKNLIESCEQVDFDWLKARCDNLRSGVNEFEVPAEFIPAPVIRLPQGAQEQAAFAEAAEVGRAALRAGKVGVFLVAGGQGSRLGFEGPKGCYKIGPCSERTLFQWHAEQIKASAKRYGVTIPWYIMTSPLNHEDTVAFFKKHDYFGLGRDNVMCFKQRMVPSVDMEYKLILAEEDQLAVNPDGHGGCLWALCNRGALEDMKSRGIEYLSYFQVDNPLVNIIDPVFVGFHVKAGAQMSSKILDKAYPEEKVGHICIADGKTTVIEYCDMSTESMHARDAQGRLLFWAGSIAIHIISTHFVEEVGGQAKLPWHVAQKKIPYVDESGQRVKPEKNNGIKFETFVFDALPLTTASVTLEVAREEEFAPVKNGEGVDSPESCRRLMSERFARWLEKAGKSVPRNAQGGVDINIEISPLFALDEEEFVRKCPAEVVVRDGLIIA